MSPITRALATAGSHLLQRGASYILKKTGPMLASGAAKLGSYLGNSALGKTASSYLMDKALNLGFDSVRKFANNKRVQARIPMVADFANNAADVYSKRLSEGYRSYLNQDGGGGGQTTQGGIEKKQQ